MNVLRAPARIMLAAPFVIDGVDAVRNPDLHAQKALRAWSTLESFGAPHLTDDQARLAARAGGVVGVAAGACLVIGKRQRGAAAVLAALTIPLALVRAPVWLAGDEAEREDARQNLIGYGALFGGLIFAALDRKGAPSLKYRRHYRQLQREAVQAAKTSTVSS